MAAVHHPGGCYILVVVSEIAPSLQSALNILNDGKALKRCKQLLKILVLAVLTLILCLPITVS